MLNDFIFSLNSVMPIFLIIALGYFLKQKGFIDTSSIKKMNGIVFNFAVPLLLFRDVYNSDLHTVFDVRLLLYAVITTIGIYAVIWFISAMFIKDGAKLGSFVQGCYRGNYAIIGISLVSSVMGGNVSGKSAIVTTFVIPLYNILAVIVLTITTAKEGKGKIGQALKNIIKNPLILGILAGLPFSLTGLRLPSAITSSVNYMAQLATPLALIAIGGSISFKAMKEGFKLSAVATFLKLVVIPLVFLTLAYSIGITDTEDMIILYVLYASPTAVNSFIMASNMGADEALASNIILMTTVISAFTFTIGIYIFKLVGII